MSEDEKNNQTRAVITDWLQKNGFMEPSFAMLAGIPINSLMRKAWEERIAAKAVEAIYKKHDHTYVLIAWAQWLHSCRVGEQNFFVFFGAEFNLLLILRG